MKITAENEREWRQKIHSHNTELPLPMGWYIDHNSSWRYVIDSSKVSSFFGCDVYYYDDDSWIRTVDPDAWTEAYLCRVEAPVTEIKAYDSLLFYQAGNSVYRYYIPTGLNEKLVELDAGADWEPVSNLTVRYTKDGVDYWYCSSAGQTLQEYSPPEIVTLEVRDVIAWKTDWEKAHNSTQPTDSTQTDTDYASDSVTEQEQSKTVTVIPTEPVATGKYLVFAIWICIGIVAVALMCIVIPVILKKKKQ